MQIGGVAKFFGSKGTIVLLSWLSVPRRIIVVLILGAATPALVAVNSLNDIRTSLIEARRAEVQHLDETAWTIVANFYRRYTQGSLSEAQAKAEAAEAVHAMRYDNGNYFFIWDLNGTGVAHGGNQALIGRNFMRGADAASKPGVADMVQKLVRIARQQGQGFVEYQIPRAGAIIPLPKIGFSKLFEPWGWAIGTGAYIDDINIVFWARAEANLFLAASMILLAALASYLIGNDLATSLTKLTSIMRKLASGDLSTEPICVGRHDEIGVMARAVQVFKDNALHARTLQEEKAAQQNEAANTSGAVVSHIGRGLERLAACDLSFRLSEGLPHAYEKLRSDFNIAAAQLQSLVDGIAVATADINAGTSEIAGAATDLTSRTDEQASRLKVTAAALDAITIGVISVGQSSLGARHLVLDVKANVEVGAKVVGEAIAAMGSIDSSFSKVAQVTGVIDNIASQTTLLALNAAIEASQYEKAGGFSVIAAEIRALAKRSGDAAKDIRILVQASTSDVERGVQLVGQAGEVLNRICDQVAETKRAIAEIADSANNQAGQLQQVNEVVAKVDVVTQQNATLVKQSKAAAQLLLCKAEALESLTAQFRVFRRHELLCL